MTAYLRAANTIAALLSLSACAARTADVSPSVGAPGSLAQNPACLHQTGSRIAAANANCSAWGRSYSSDDIERTGSVTAGEALRLMDPSITVHR
jgi:hypothetical protein